MPSPNGDDGEPWVTDEAWNRLLAVKKRDLTRLVEEGTLAGKRSGKQVLINTGAFSDWSLSPPVQSGGWSSTSCPTSGRPRSRRSGKSGARPGGPCQLLAGPAPETQGWADKITQLLTDSLRDRLPALSCELGSLDRAIQETAQEFDGEDPALPEVRRVLESAEGRLQELRDSMSKLLGDEIELLEPDEDALELARRILTGRRVADRSAHYDHVVAVPPGQRHHRPGRSSTAPRERLYAKATWNAERGASRWLSLFQVTSYNPHAMTSAKRVEMDVDFAAMHSQVVELLREYVRIDTTNPPGDVSRAADWVEGALWAGGMESLRLASSERKPNVVATLGDGDASRALVLAHHMDVVPAVRENWRTEPFGGEVRDGFVWGRGTLDMKGFGVLSLVCALAIKRLGLPLVRPLRILATADEEVGGIDGASWLAANHLGDVSGEFLLTEGSFARAGPRATYYAVQIAEKGVSTAKLTARGQPGHASSPRDDNSVTRMAQAIARFGPYRSPPAALELARRYLAAFPPRVLRLDEGRTVESLTDREMEDLLYTLSGGSRIQNMLRNTYVPTMINAGLGQNVIPPSCEAYVDCRLVPGVTLDDVRAELATVIDDPEIEIEFVKSSVGTESPVESALFEAVRDAVHTERPEAAVVPYLTSGGTDCKHFRPHGIICYGHIPFELDDSETERIHGVDERVSLENLKRAFRILFRTVVNLCCEQ